MLIQYTKEKKNQTLEFHGTILALLESLQINPETVIVSVNGVLCGDDHLITNNDTVTIFSVISGG